MELKDKNGLTEKEFIEQYRPGDYPRPSMTVDILIFAAPGLTGRLTIPDFAERGVKILLIRRGGHPCLGRWALPGGFVGPEETVTQAAFRELKEETGVEGLPLKQLYTFSMPGRDPRTWVMTCAHIALIDTGSVTLRAGDDAAEAAWFDVSIRIMKHKNQGARYLLRLANGETVLTALLESPEGLFTEDTCRVLDNQGLAFDHPKIILCGIKELLGL